jgi:hypothetical protein
MHCSLRYRYPGSVECRSVAWLFGAGRAPSLIVENFLPAIAVTSGVSENLGVEAIAGGSVICRLGQILWTQCYWKSRCHYEHDSYAHHNNDCANEIFARFRSGLGLRFARKGADRGDGDGP